jgi:membrane-associated phospholipid phosphatase
MSLPRSSWLALVVSLILTLMFIAWSMQALSDGPIPTFDREVAITFRDASSEHHLRREIMVVFTHLGGVPAMTLLAIGGALWQWRRGDKLLAAVWLLLPLSGGLLDLGLKIGLDRARPLAEWRDRAVHETNQSFPSGHAMGSLIGYGMLGYAAVQSTRRGLTKAAVLVLLGVVVGLIGFSRIYLRAHWVSDIVGGYVIGAAWLAFCLAWLHAARARTKAPLAA